MKSIVQLIDSSATTDNVHTFTLAFTKEDADALAALCDVALKGAGLPAAQAVVRWMDLVREALERPAAAEPPGSAPGSAEPGGLTGGG